MSLVKASIITFLLFSLIAPAITAVGLYIPLYMYPDAANWLKVIEIKKTYPNLPIIVIINPNSGPGKAVDPTYTDYINQLLAAGISVHAYDHTTNTDRPIEDVKADIDAYKSFYPQINGIFFDEMKNTAGGESYYATASEYARSQGFSVTDGNPGTNTIESYKDTVNIFLISETEKTIDLSISSSWPTRDPARLALMVHTEPILPKDWVIEACKVSGWLYITDEIMPNPYNKLPTYFTDLAALIDGTCNKTNEPNKPITGIVLGALGGLVLIAGILYGVRKYRVRRESQKIGALIHEETI